MESVRPRTQYARSGDISIAYQVIGNDKADLDIVFVPGWISHVEHMWEEPRVAHYLRRLSSFARLLIFDKRGTGMSDRTLDLPPLEQRMDDVQAVMEAAESRRAALVGVSEGGVMCALFAATYPEKTEALVLYGCYGSRLRSAEYPWAPSLEDRERFYQDIRENWGGPVDIDVLAPSMAGDAAFRKAWATYLRMGASPGAALALARINSQADIRHVLPAIRVPTLVLHRVGDVDMKIEEGRYIAGHIPDAKYVELPGNDHLWWAGDTDAILDEVEIFLTGVRRAGTVDRVLATILVMDIVGSTEQAAAMGDERWSSLLQAYYSQARRELERFHGRERSVAGDGFLATFDGPSRAIRCAAAIVAAASRLGLHVRAGLHCGECELIGDDVGGIAVHVGARVAALAGPDAVLVSSMVKDLVAGAGIEFEPRGVHQLKGVPGEWPLFAVA